MKNHSTSLASADLAASLRLMMRCFLLCIFFVAGGFIGQAKAGEDRDGSPRKSFDAKSNGIDSIKIGIDGLYRVGRWTRISFDANLSTIETLSLETRDGDSVPVQFVAPHLVESFKAPSDGDATSQVHAYIKSGTEAAPLIIRGDDVRLYEDRLPPVGNLSDRPTMIAEQKPWVVAIGDSMGIEKLGVDVINRDPAVAVSKITSAVQLPDQSIGWDGVDVIVVNAACAPNIVGASVAQQNALIDWVHNGGSLLMMLGESTRTLLEAAPWMKRLIPFEPDVVVTFSPSGLETFTASQTPLEPYRGVRLPKDLGEALIRGRTSRRISVPLATRFSVGFGQVTILAADLHDQNFADWPERMDLLHTLTNQKLADLGNHSSSGNSSAYDDLSGQLRSTMDQYASAVRLPFSVIALMMLALIALIGPLDYWFVNRVLGRPPAGWITFTIVVFILSAGLVWRSTVQDAAPIQKRIEVLDINIAGHEVAEDSESSSSQAPARITMLSHLYSKDAVRLDVALTPSHWVARNHVAGQTATLSALGYPGSAFGGVRLSSEDERIGSYQSVLPLNTTPPRLGGLPLPPRSSKSLVGQLNVGPPIKSHGQLFEGGVQRRRGSELLQGSITNPLGVDLLDARLIYQNWVYLLPTRFVAGATIGNIDQLRQKNFRWLLSRQKALESSSQNEAWASVPQDLDRVLEMMLYHEAAGGADYTSLNHRPLGHLDLSQMLQKDRCLLVGKVEEPICDLVLSDSRDQSSPEVRTERTSVVRILLPAAYRQD